MELSHTLPNTGRTVQDSALGPAVGIALATFVVLLFVSSCGFYVAARDGLVPPVDLHLTLDGRHALVIHNDLRCVPEEPPQPLCGGGMWPHEFKVVYSAPEQDWVLVAFKLPNS